MLVICLLYIYGWHCIKETVVDKPHIKKKINISEPKHK